MKIRITSEDEFILKSISEIIKAQGNDDKNAYSSTYEYGLTELVRIYMRKIAQDSNKYIQNDRMLIDEAYRRATSEIQMRTDIDVTDIRFESVYKSLTKNLRYPAKEISQLKNNLETSKQVERIGKRERLVGPETPPFEIIELGLKDKIEGLLALPLIKEFEIDLDRIKERYDIKGDWFPFEIEVGDIVFVLDDDGSIFTSTENFPEHAFSEAHEKLQKIAQIVYPQN